MHHQKLSELLKVRRDDPQASASANSSIGTLHAASNTVSATTTAQFTTKAAETGSRQVSQIPSIQATAQHRDLSSSIASNLASARGIPAPRSRRVNHALAQVSSLNAEGRLLKPARRSNLGENEVKASLQSEKSPLNPIASPSVQHRTLAVDKHASPVNREMPAVPSPTTVQSSEDPFSRFYSTFGNIISTLSAPLAFAGLPLTSEASSKDVETVLDKPKSPSSSRVAADPELARYFSRAALHAIRDEHGGFGGAESFYVVPTTGGTMSYAGMLSNNRQGSNLTEEDETEFVDASENPQPASPGLRRQRDGRLGAGSGQQVGRTGKTWEELCVENETLKAVVLDLGDRLRAFELGAQRSSRALHASVRALSSPTGSVRAGSAIPPMPGVEGMKVLQEKMRETEEETKGLRKENKRLARENQKLIGVIERYRERWEMLKVNARERVKGDSASNHTHAGSEPQE